MLCIDLKNNFKSSSSQQGFLIWIVNVMESKCYKQFHVLEIAEEVTTQGGQNKGKLYSIFLLFPVCNMFWNMRLAQNIFYYTLIKL